MSGGRKPENQQARARIAERWHRAAPICLVVPRAASDFSDAATVLPQPRTAIAGDDFCLERAELGRTQVSVWHRRTRLRERRVSVIRPDSCDCRVF
jgi:hypothetical protein